MYCDEEVIEKEGIKQFFPLEVRVDLSILLN